MEKYFFVVDERISGNGDIFRDIYPTEKATIEAAEEAWSHLTKSEQAVRHI